MQKDIIRVLNYFNIFSYSPDLNDIHLFLSKKSSKEILHKVLKKMVSDKKIENFNGLYTLGEYNINSKVKSQKHALYRSEASGSGSKFEITQKKLNNLRFRAYIKLISLFPQVKLVGLSGSAAMYNAGKNDDIDLFIISKAKRLWTTRFLCVFISMILGIKRARFELHPSDKVCLNLFYEETNLKIPKFKQNYYIAHEIIQMKPLINKSSTYELFLDSNKWVCDIFPNFKLKTILSSPTSKLSFPTRSGIQSWIPAFAGMTRKWPGTIVGVLGITYVSDFIELISKKFQLSIINRHKTTEIITDTQLWFFPEDFAEKLPKWTRKKYNKI